MNQHITEEQFFKLDAKSQDYLCNWALERHYELKLIAKVATDLFEQKYAVCLNIGQMIELLFEEAKKNGERVLITTGFKFLVRTDKEWIVSIGKPDDDILKKGNNLHFADELCDALWEVVKHILMSKNL